MMKPPEPLQNASKNYPQNPKNSSKTYFHKLFSASVFSAIVSTSFAIATTLENVDSLNADSFIPPPPHRYNPY